MADIGILKAMLNHDTYVKYSPVLLQLKNTEREFGLILDTVREYYIRYKDQKVISISDLAAFFALLNPAISNQETYDDLFRQIDATVIDNPELMVDMLNQIVERHYAGMIGSECIKLMEGGSGSIANVSLLIKELKGITETTTDDEADVCNLSLRELLEKDAEGDLKWRLPFIQEIIGSPKPGTLGHVFARPETGKTSFVLDMMCGFARQLAPTNATLLYLSNEEGIERLRLRAYCAMLGRTKQAISDNVEEAEKWWVAYGGDRLKMIGGCTHIDLVEKYINHFKPQVVAIDQGPKVNIHGKEDNVRKLQLLYNSYRELAKEYNTAILTAGQADNLSENRKLLGLNNMDFSKVGIPGELDYAIGIGMTNEPGMENRRYINISKNKLRGIRANTTTYLDVPKCRYGQQAGGGQ